MTTLNKFAKTIDMRSIAIYLIIIVTLCSNQTWAGQECSKKNLKLKNCLFQMDHNKVHVWDNKIFLNSSAARDTEKLQVETEIDNATVDWQFIRSKKIGGRWILELGLWLPPQGQSEVETLIWSVFEVKPGNLTKQIEQPVQKRKKIGENKFRYDKILSYGLIFKKLKIDWHVDREKGSF